MSIVEGFRESPSQEYVAAIARFYQGTTVVGTGFRVSEHYILTCAHVVSQCILGKKSAENILTADLADKLLEVDFPVDLSRQRLTAKIVPELWRVSNEDIAVLKLTSPAFSQVRIITLRSDFPDYWDHQFAVYGFPKKRPDGRWVDGKLLRPQPGIDRVQMEGTRAEGLGIEPGFSGSPVWDERLAGVVGMVVARDTEESAKISFMIPYKKLKPALESIALFELLLPEADRLVSHWQAAYRLLRPDRSTELLATTLSEADVTQREGDYRAIEQFVGYLALPKLGLDIQPRLLEWLQRQVESVPALLQVVRQKEAEQKAKQPAVLAPHLLFWVQEELNSDRYSVQAYLIPSRNHYDAIEATGMERLTDLDELFEADEKVSQSNLKGILRASLNESIQKLAPEADDFPTIQVEIFLSRRFLSQQDPNWWVDQWQAAEQDKYNLNPESIGSRYRLVLRSADRLEEVRRDYQKKILWNKKWSCLEKNQGSSAAQVLICGDAKELGDLDKDLSSDEIIGWHRFQPSPSVDEDQPCPLSILVGKGAPVAVWLRKSVSGDAQASDAQAAQANDAQAFAELLSRRLSELLSGVSTLRRAAHQRRDKSSPHIGENIGLIWDDPKLVPPKPRRLRMSA
jgi:vWA-MoxR associated protein C-terminal domain/Trypsin-like peptidase domain/vWA-MoxR associated protein middle region (VMAP-M) 1